MDLISLKEQIQAAFQLFEKNRVTHRIEELEILRQKPHFWDSPKEAQKVTSELSGLQKSINTWNTLKISLETLEELGEMFSSEEYEKEVELLSNSIQKAKIDLFLSEEYDNHNAIISLSVGAGGVDANDWTEMVFRMLMKYCEKKGWKTQVLDVQDAEVAGIKGATFRVFGGEHIFGYLKGEQGAHRLVRPSPFNSKGTRETSFANVEVIPEIEENSEMRIDEKDLRIDTFRSQGAGGQHVNTTDSAVRITHIPTGIVVQCQNERSQIQNRAQAMKVLESKLAELKRREQEEKNNALKAEKVHASFGGGRIRSYVLDDRYVKDERTGIKSSQVEKVLEGDLENFIEGYIMQRT